MEENDVYNEFDINERNANEYEADPSGFFNKTGNPFVGFMRFLKRKPVPPKEIDEQEMLQALSEHFSNRAEYGSKAGIQAGGVVVSASVKVAGDNFNHAIMNYVREKHSLFIGEDAAENIKIKIGTASEEADLRTMEVKGRNIITGLPKVATLTSEEIRTALRETTGQIVEAVHGVLEKTPPELAADIMDRGIVLTGGGAMLHGMDTLIEQKTGVSTLTVQDAMLVVAAGTGKYAEIMSRV